MKKVIRLTESDLTRIIKRVVSEMDKTNDKSWLKNALEKLLSKSSEVKDAYNKSKKQRNIMPLLDLIPDKRKQEVINKASKLAKNIGQLKSEISKEVPVSEQVSVWLIIQITILVLAIIFLTNPDRVYYGTDIKRLGQIDFFYQ